MLRPGERRMVEQGGYGTVSDVVVELPVTDDGDGEDGSFLGICRYILCLPWPPRPLRRWSLVPSSRIIQDEHLPYLSGSWHSKSAPA